MRAIQPLHAEDNSRTRILRSMGSPVEQAGTWTQVFCWLVQSLYTLLVMPYFARRSLSLSLWGKASGNGVRRTGLTSLKTATVVIAALILLPWWSLVVRPAGAIFRRSFRIVWVANELVTTACGKEGTEPCTLGNFWQKCGCGGQYHRSTVA